MLDIKLIRENPELVKKDLEKRKDTEKIKWLDDLIKKDKELLKLKKEVDDLRHSRNKLSEKINQLKKENKSADSEIKKAKAIPKQLNSLEERQKELQEKTKYYLMRIPNISHKSVPYGKDESDNKQIRKIGEIKKFTFKLKSHGEIIQSFYPKSFKKGTQVAGRGFYYLNDKMALLDRALVNFTIDFLLKKKYELMYHPFALNKKAYEGATDLEKFKDTLYKIEGEDLYLLSTSEHPIDAFFSNSVLEEKELPKKIVGYATCFRKEIGSHGIDERGLHRVHQFNKVEQFIVCKPEDSWKIHEELLKTSEELMKKLKLPYRIVNACTGDLPVTTAKMYDIETYMPREKKYKEVGSCSNCTSYQAVRSNIKYHSKKGKENVHTLNSTAIATSRILRAILENYQTKEGYIKIPIVLQKYMNGLKIIK